MYWGAARCRQAGIIVSLSQPLATCLAWIVRVASAEIESPAAGKDWRWLLRDPPKARQLVANLMTEASPPKFLVWFTFRVESFVPLF